MVTGKSAVLGKPYRIVELTPWETRINFGLQHALKFNACYTVAATHALRSEQFDVLHHVLPFAVGKTPNIAAVRHRAVTPYVVGPVQPLISVRDTDIDPKDLTSSPSMGRNRATSVRRAITQRFGSFSSDVIAPLAFSRLSRLTIARASAVIAVNEEASKLLVRSGAPADRVVVIPPGIDVRRFGRADLRSGNSTVEILSVSRLLKRKNVDIIIRAFAAVAEAVPQARLRIVGDGPERQALTMLASHLGVGEKVTFRGFIPNSAVHEEYQHADIFVNASAAEGFATTCLEALASGLPVVSTTVGGFADAIQDGQNGYLIGMADAGQLSVRLRKLLADASLVGRLSVRARELAEQRFDWDKAVVPRYRDVYERVVDERRRRRHAASDRGGER